MGRWFGHWWRRTGTQPTDIGVAGFLSIARRAGKALTPKKTMYDAGDGKLRKTSTSPVNVYAFFDFFPRKTNLTTLPKINVPTLSAGLPLGSQSFNRPVFGSSLGLNFFGMRISPFVGVVLLREPRPKTLTLDSTATASQLKADLTSHRNVRLFISVNFSLKDAAGLVKSAAKSTSNSGTKSNASRRRKNAEGPETESHDHEAGSEPHSVRGRSEEGEQRKVHDLH